MKVIETKLLENEQRFVIVETSATPKYEKARNFYLKSKYQQKGNVPDYWGENDDMVLFWKKLQPI